MSRGASAASLVGCVAILAMHWSAGSLACSTDTSNCTDSHVKGMTYRGTLVDRQGRALPDTPFTVGFRSGVPSRNLGAFTTDRAGNYCILTGESARPALCDARDRVKAAFRRRRHVTKLWTSITLPPESDAAVRSPAKVMPSFVEKHHFADGGIGGVPRSIREVLLFHISAL